MMRKKQKEGLQGATFGMMEGVVMVIAMLFGFVAAGLERDVMILAIILTAFADGVANTSAFYVSEETETFHSRREILKSAGFTFLGTVVAFTLPVMPLLFLPVSEALIGSIIIAVLMFLFLGQFVGRIANRDPIKLSFKYLVIGIIAAVVAYVAANFIELLL